MARTSRPIFRATASRDTAFTLRVIRAMAAALDYTHSRGVVHRDIKPANVMLDAARTPKITDFGIARITEGATTTVTGTVMGTIEYMAPEQVRGEVVDGRADQFALGVVAYRMLTGHTLFGDQSLATLAYKIVNETPPLVRSHNTQLPPAMDSVLAKALAKDPKDRYPKCSDFADALAVAFAGVDARAAALPEVVREAPTVAMPPPVGAPAVEKRASKLPVLAAAGVAAVAAIAGIALWKPWASSAPVVTKGAVTASAVEPGAPGTPVAPPDAQAAVSLPAVEPPAPVKSAEATPVKAAKSEKKSVPVEPETPKPAPPPAVPVSAEDAFARGRELMQNQDYNGAIQAFSKAADLRPNWGQPYHSRGNAYQALGQNEAAIRDYSHAILINATMPMFLLSRANCYIKMGKDDAALADLNQALAIKGDGPVILASRADIFLRRKEFQKALSDLNELIRLEPRNIRAYRQRATAKRSLGDRPGARADVEKANELAAQKGGG